MIRRIFALVLTYLLPEAAIAQACGALPYTLTNGTTADASQVMANFNHLLNCPTSQAPLLRGWIAGLKMSNNSGNPNGAIDTQAGVANSNDATTLMSLPEFSKNANSAWSAGSGTGCLDSGSSLAASTWYHLFVIARIDTGVVDQLCSTSAGAPALPTNYTKHRRIGSFRTNASSQIIAFAQRGESFRWEVPVLDLDATNPGTTSVNRYLTVPTGVAVTALINVSTVGSSAGFGVYLSDFGTSNVAPSTTAAPLMHLMSPAANTGAFASVQVITSTSGSIRSHMNASDSSTRFRIATLGWIDTRGRFD